MSTFYISTGINNVVEVEGRRVAVPGWEPYQFILHKTLMHKGIDGLLKWTVSEFSTGLAISYGATQKAVKVNTIKRLNHMGSHGFFFQVLIHLIQGNIYCSLTNNPWVDPYVEDPNRVTVEVARLLSEAQTGEFKCLSYVPHG